MNEARQDGRGGRLARLRPSGAAVITGGSAGLVAGGIPMMLMHLHPAVAVAVSAGSCFTLMSGTQVALEWIKGRERRLGLRVWGRVTERQTRQIIHAMGGSLSEENGMRLLEHAFAQKPSLEPASTPWQDPVEVHIVDVAAVGGAVADGAVVEHPVLDQGSERRGAAWVEPPPFGQAGSGPGWGGWVAPAGLSSVVGVEDATGFEA
jgi:hypothetical protein